MMLVVSYSLLFSVSEEKLTYTFVCSYHTLYIILCLQCIYNCVCYTTIKGVLSNR